MRSTVLRSTAAAGWASFAIIVGGLVVLSMVIAGEPPTPDAPASAGMAYFDHPSLVPLYAAANVAAVLMIAFALGLRSLLGRERPLAALGGDLGLAILVAAVPVYIASGALQIALVSLAGDGSDAFAGLWRVYNVLYNGAGDVLEGAWIGAFSVGMLATPLPRGLAWLGIGVAALRLIKSLMPFVSLPAAMSIVSGIPFIVWFAWAVIAVTQASRRESRQPAAPPVPA